MGGNPGTGEHRSTNCERRKADTRIRVDSKGHKKANLRGEAIVDEED
jgi:hypothetical protein